MTFKKNVLVVEDHASIRLLLSTMLSKQFSVVAKKDGLDGMVWLGNGNIPDLIVLDMGLPQLDGFEFLQSIRNSGFFKDIPVVVLSANDDEEDRQQCQQLGIQSYHTKPFNPIELNSEIARLLYSPMEAVAH